MSTAMQEWPRRHRISVEQFYRMGEVGLFAPDERMELIEGEIIDMAPIGPRHAYWVQQLGAVLFTALGSRALVRQQLPIRLGPSCEPQPDIAVVAVRADGYLSAHPTAPDVRLIVEVSDTTLRFDRDEKAPLYASYGIPELWIVDLAANQVLAYREPRDGLYAVALAGAFAARSPVSFPDVVIDLARLG